MQGREYRARGTLASRLSFTTIAQARISATYPNRALVHQSSRHLLPPLQDSMVKISSIHAFSALVLILGTTVHSVRGEDDFEYLNKHYFDSAFWNASVTSSRVTGTPWDACDVFYQHYFVITGCYGTVLRVGCSECDKITLAPTGEWKVVSLPCSHGQNCRYYVDGSVERGTCQ